MSMDEGDETATLGDPDGSTASLGPYRLKQKLGEGGMGEVWLAQQTEPVRRRVAVKVIKAGMDTKLVIARFEAERQALALMDHPSIAKVFDAGSTERGLPYFVMEYVAGEPITSYCDRHRLRTRERLGLFREVCDGVQHAHQKGVIHRDLKPSNVLVTVAGGRPLPKIIDFGVAKATAQRLTEHTVFTELGVLIGTPEYMSPEQAEMTGLDVDTRTDVYSLGVMLYELLTGALPFDRKELRAAGIDEIRRQIREVEPQRPSTKVRTLGDRSDEVASHRGTEPHRLASRLKGDLDWVVMRAIEKDRTRRYGTPAELAADLGRHLEHQPVAAGPPSPAYRARKFVRRHRIGVAVAAAAGVALTAFGITMAIQTARISRERDRANREAEVARRVSSFLADLFKVSDPSVALGNTLTAREILDRGAARIEKDLADSPEVQAQLLHTMAVVYTGLGVYDTAESLLERGVEIRSRILGKDHQATLISLAFLGSIYERQDRYEEAGKTYREALEGQRRTLGDDHPETIWSVNNVASNLEDTGKLEESAALFREVLERRRAILGEEHPDTLTAMTNAARLEGFLGHPDKAADLQRRALELQRRLLGGNHPSTTASMAYLGMHLAAMGRYDEAGALYREAIEIRRRVMGPEHPRTLATIFNYGVALVQAEDFRGAEAALREVYETSIRTRGANDRNTASSAYKLACVFALQVRPGDALAWLRRAVDAGYDDAKELAKDEELASLRPLPEFQAIVREIGGGAPAPAAAR